MLTPAILTRYFAAKEAYSSGTMFLALTRINHIIGGSTEDSRAIL